MSEVDRIPGESGVGSSGEYKRDALADGIGRTRLPPRIPSQANPWSSTSAASAAREDLPSTGFSNLSDIRTGDRPMAPQRNSSWNVNPWGSDTPTAIDPGLPKSARDALPPAGPSDGGSPDSVDGLQHSLSDLTLGRKDGRPPPQSGVIPTPAAAGGTSRSSQAAEADSARERSLFEAAMGGDAKAWDPLGAT